MCSVKTVWPELRPHRPDPRQTASPYAFYVAVTCLFTCIGAYTSASFQGLEKSPPYTHTHHLLVFLLVLGPTLRLLFKASKRVPPTHTHTPFTFLFTCIRAYTSASFQGLENSPPLYTKSHTPFTFISTCITARLLFRASKIVPPPPPPFSHTPFTFIYTCITVRHLFRALKIDPPYTHTHTPSAPPPLSL